MNVIARVMLASLLASLLLFVWGAVFWMNVPFESMGMKELPREFAVMAQVDLDTGIYLYPYSSEPLLGEPEGAAHARFVDEQKRGPLLEVMFRRQGVDMTSGNFFLAGFLQLYAASLMGSIVLGCVRGALPKFRSRFGVVVGMTLFAILLVDLANPVWYHRPWLYNSYVAAFHLGEGVLAGIVLGVLIRPDKVRPVVAPPQ